MNGIEIRDLEVRFGSRVALDLPAAALPVDHVGLVLGPNGSGKTTLLKVLAGLLEPTRGAFAPRLSPGAGGAVYVHSVPYLFDGSVWRNVTLALPSAAAEAAEKALADMRASHLRDRHVAELSTGERQRAALARAIALRPRLLLVDEPEGGLDREALALWSEWLAATVRDRSCQVVIASHHPLHLAQLPTYEINLS